MSLPDGTPSRPFYVKEIGPSSYVIRMVECDGLGDTGFLLKPPGKSGWTHREHAVAWAEKLNDRYVYDAGEGA
jgi:hypothetical protein